MAIPLQEQAGMKALAGLVVQSQADRRYHVPTGPFNLAAGDTQEIVIAIPIARGTDNINSITKLRELAAHVQEFYNTELVEILKHKTNYCTNRLCFISKLS